MTLVPSADRSQRILALQILRAVAATMIVLLHAQSMIEQHAVSHGYRFTRFSLLPFGAGVDLFFVISGFVVVYASKDVFSKPGGTREFIRRRIIRIVPLYWAALTLRLFVLAVGAAVGIKAFPDSTAILTSYLFIPYDALGYGSNYLFPILDLGWTLNYEMFFYALLACLMGFSRTRAVWVFVVLVLSAVIVAGMYPPNNDALRFLLQPIIVEFALRTLIALLFLKRFALSNSVRFVMIVAGLSLWVALPPSWFVDTSGPGFYSWARTSIWGMGAALIVAATVLGSSRVTSGWHQSLASLGDSSYALYLLHPFVFLIIKALIARGELPENGLWPLAVASTILAIGLCHQVHRLLEVPSLRLLKEKTQRFDLQLKPMPR